MVFIGDIVNTHGIKGELRILSDFKYKEAVFKKNQRLYIGKRKQEVVIKTYRRHKIFDMVTFIDVDSINDAIAFKGDEVFVKREDLIIDGYVDEDIIGLEVFSEEKLVGTVEQVDENTVSVNTDAGVGFEVICTQADAASFATEKGNQTVFTYLQVREDAMVLYGFKTLEVKAMFLKLITISGIGPKMAISILSETTPEDLSYSIVNSDVKALSRVKGLGKKTAERIILELKEKVSAIATDIKKTNKQASPETGKLTAEQEDSVIALCSLGLSKTNATKLVIENSTPEMKAEEIVAICIKNMGAR